MKINLTIIAALTLLFFSGCGSSSDKQSREELKEELKQELKGEAADDTESLEEQKTAANTGSKSVNELRMKDFTKQMVENAGLEYKEKIIFGKAWDDKNGENILVFTEGIETIAEHDDHGGDEERWNFHAYHYADDGSGFELKREIKDFVTCYFLAGKFFKSSVNITDIDKDGKAEITFAYHVGCSPDGVSLYPAKVMMLEDGEKYAIRGTTYLEQVKPPGGYETNIGENFQNAPEGFLDFAKEIWEKYRHRNVKDDVSNGKVTGLQEEPATAKAPAITFEELQNAVFFGTEPFWSIKFRDNGMYYESGSGEGEMLYNYMVHSGSETPVRAISENAVRVDVYAAKKGNDSYRWQITIREEPCSDGMSENTYPYSIEISWEDTEEMDSGKIGEGCGRIDKKRVNIEEIKNTKKIKRYTVSEVMHEPGREFDIGLKDTFDFSGYFTLDPMSGMLKFHVNDRKKPGIELKIEDYSRPLFTSFHFTNEEDVKTALGKEKVNQIRNKEKVQAHVFFKNYHVSGKLDGYGGASAEFVKMGN